ncbi:unnamed protein product [Urochloa humidicola]
MDEPACAGSEKARKKKRARLTPKKNRNKPDEEEKAARAGSEEEEEKAGKKKALRTPVPLTFGISMRRLKDAEARAGKRRKKVTIRLDKELVECFVQESLPPPFEPFPSLHPGSVERQERLSAALRAEHEERDAILRQYEELGYAEVEIEVTDEDEREQQGSKLANKK